MRQPAEGFIPFLLCIVQLALMPYVLDGLLLTFGALGVLKKSVRIFAHKESRHVIRKQGKMAT